MVSLLDCQIPELTAASRRVESAEFADRVVVVNYIKLKTLEDDLYRALNALEPFAELAKNFVDPASRRIKPDGNEVWGYNNDTLTYGDFRAVYEIFHPAESNKQRKLANDPDFETYLMLKERYEGKTA